MCTHSSGGRGAAPLGGGGLEPGGLEEKTGESRWFILMTKSLPSAAEFGVPLNP